MPRYKRTRDEAELDIPLEPQVAPEHVETLSRLRNMWEFASLMQYIYLFGHVVKIDDDFDIEDLEAECLKSPPSERLANIGLQLLKYVSSHRGLTPEIFDEYTRRQYVAKAPTRNPFGQEEEPANFNEFDIDTRIRVLHQLGTWTLGNVDRIRGMMPQDEDHLNWRMEPVGWDKDDRAYFVLDDNRLYRRSDEPVPEPELPKPKPKAKSKSARKSRGKATRASKRRKVEDTSDEELGHEEMDVEDAEAGVQDDTVMTNGDLPKVEDEPGYGFTSKTWECVAITLDEYQEFLATIFRSRDPNEKQLRKRLEEDVLPIIEKRAEQLRQKQLKKLRELENLQKMATAKRSSRLADKADREKEEQEKREAEEKKQRDIKMAHKEEERQRQIEEGHESRRLTREQRLKEREVKRILHEEELAKLQELEDRSGSHDPNNESVDAKRISERQAKTQKEQHKTELAKLAEEDGKWYFDCAKCGMHGENLDDGSHSVACDKCGVWQHSKCHGFTPKQAEKERFSFVCNTCKHKEEDAKKPRIPPLRLGKSKTSASPETQKSASRPVTASGAKDSGLPPHVARQLDGDYAPQQHGPSPGPFGRITDGPSLSPQGQVQGPPGYRHPPVGNFALHQPQQPWHGSQLPPPVRPSSSTYSSPPPPPPIGNGYGHSPHQQQHQHAHQSAIVAAGGHPGYQPQYTHPPNGYGSQVSNGQYSMPQPHQQGNHQLQHYSPHQQQPYHYQHQPPPQHRPTSGQLMNAFQSPTKEGVQPASSSPRKLPHPQGPSQSFQRSPHPAASSPKTSLPPATNGYKNGQSPAKSSTPSSQSLQYSAQQTPRLVQTPQNLQPNISNGHQPYLTPRMPPSSSRANGLVADGMSGPWPEGSEVIPRKHDQSPAPPSSSQSIGETKVMPPVAALTPSPSQHAEGSAGNIPVKKLPEVSGTPLQLTKVLDGHQL